MASKRFDFNEIDDFDKHSPCLFHITKACLSIRNFLPKAEDVTFDIKAYLEMNRDNIENIDEVYQRLNSYYEDMLKVLDRQIKALFSMDSEFLEKRTPANFCFACTALHNFINILV